MLTTYPKVGGLLATIINYATSTRTDQWAYRTVIVLQLAIPVILFAGAFVVPESPRTLLIKKEQEEATKVLMWLRKGTSQELVYEEVRLIDEAIQEQNSLHYAATYLDCFRRVPKSDTCQNKS